MKGNKDVFTIHIMCVTQLEIAYSSMALEYPLDCTQEIKMKNLADSFCSSTLLLILGRRSVGVTSLIAVRDATRVIRVSLPVCVYV